MGKRDNYGLWNPSNYFILHIMFTLLDKRQEPV